MIARFSINPPLLFSSRKEEEEVHDAVKNRWRSFVILALAFDYDIAKLPSNLHLRSLSPRPGPRRTRRSRFFLLLRGARKRKIYAKPLIFEARKKFAYAVIWALLLALKLPQVLYLEATPCAIRAVQGIQQTCLD